MVLIVSTLTTPGTTFRTMGAKLPRGRPSRGTAVSSNGTLMCGVSVLALEPWLTASAEPAATTAPAIAKTDSRLLSVLDIVFIIIIVLFIVSVELDSWRRDWKLSGALQNCKNETLPEPRRTRYQRRFDSSRVCTRCFALNVFKPSDAHAASVFNCAGSLSGHEHKAVFPKVVPDRAMWCRIKAVDATWRSFR